MQSDLWTRWEIDSREKPSSRGNIDIPKLLSDWFADPVWRMQAQDIPATERRNVLADMGLQAFKENTGNFASELTWNLDLMNWLWTASERRALAADHAEHLFSSVSDSLDFACGDHNSNEVTCHGVEYIEQAKQQGRGIILACVFQSHPGYAAYSNALKDMNIGVIKMDTGQEQSLTLDGLPDNVTELPASFTAVKRMFNLLGNGQVIAAYCDYIYAHTKGVEAPMFGRYTTISRSLLKIAMQTNASIIPMSVARQSARGDSPVHVEFFPDLTFSANGEGALESLAFKFGVTLECLIRRHPAQWRLWNTLRGRLC